ncbi:hypothetical protein PDUR_21575 [Paenibacillus durus]|uniref:Uncharacterized protein n=1 Tax=Paenibacillus durus TaxID=44251 RepID=A0A089HSY9_PAEDU|nr:hypothetical protein PDUR_21575 [Paenibacillus durus]
MQPTERLFGIMFRTILQLEWNLVMEQSKLLVDEFIIIVAGFQKPLHHIIVLMNGHLRILRQELTGVKVSIT